MCRTVTLRIKRKFFDQILAGTKLVEYRDDKTFYQKLLGQGERISRLRLHYQSGRMLEASVDSVNLVDAPAYLKTTGIEFTPRVFAIIVRNAQLITA